MQMKNKGFTLIELIMVIVILGILAAVAIPRFQDLAGDANASAEQGVVGGVRAGIATLHAFNTANNIAPAYPATLDAAANGACTTVNACFTTVLAQGGITADWSKAGLVYTGPDGGTYTYAPATGSFQ